MTHYHRKPKVTRVNFPWIARQWAHPRTIIHEPSPTNRPDCIKMRFEFWFNQISNSIWHSMFSMFYLLYKIFRIEQVPFKDLFKIFFFSSQFLEWILAFQTTRDLRKNLKIPNVIKSHGMKVLEVTEIQNLCHQRIMIGRSVREDVTKMKYLPTSGQLQEAKVEKIFSALMKVSSL